ncbi:MAG: HU family DNA-binding protein [Paludibacteraceae bacterium]|nr:HU family DNA-binding protein [Paludibacteraceae bacterium]
MVKITNTSILSAFRKQVGISKVGEIAFAEAFQSIFEEALLRDKILKISGLGTFKLVPVESRKSVNVNTGEEFEIASHYKLTFTPDVALKDKVNEPLAHLETVELDSDVVVEKVVEEQVIHQNTSDETQEVAHLQDDPLQKLTEQALELKDILADIQGLGEQVEIQQPAEEIENIVLSDQSDLSDLSDLSDHSDSSGSSTSSDQSNLSDSQQKLVSAQDIVAAINREDTAPNSKQSKVWIGVAIILFVGIVGLLVYQNLDFFTSSPKNELNTPIIADTEQSLVDSTIQIETDSILAQELKVDTTEVLESQILVDSSLSIDKTSPIYSEQFPDLFNQKREYTEFVDTVTLNEGSRLTWISLKHLGHKDFWVYIYEANMDVISNPNSIRIGTKLRIPKLPSELIDANNPQTLEYAKYLHDVYVKK